MPITPDTSVNVLDHLKAVHQLPKGDLYIKFDILFPRKLHHHHKKTIIEALRLNDEENQ
jgi:DnaJ-class molecular chaperone